MTTRKSAFHARGAHLALQARRDALARIRAGEIAVVRLARDAGGATVTARSLGAEESPHGKTVLVILERRLRAELCVDHEGRLCVGGRRRIGRNDILGVAVAINGKPA